jgi:hypothetical protein
MAHWTARAKWGRRPLRLMASVPCRWASPLNEGLGVRVAAPSLDLCCEFFNSGPLKKTLALRSVVTASSSELAEESHCVYDAEFSHKRISSSLRYLSDGVKVCSHCGISETRPRSEMGTTFRFASSLARRSSLSSVVTK